MSLGGRATQRARAQYELPLPKHPAGPGKAAASSADLECGSASLEARWYCRVRWGVAAVLAGVSLFQGSRWLSTLVAATALCASNLLLAWCVAAKEHPPSKQRAETVIALQLGVDLLITLWLVHRFGACSPAALAFLLVILAAGLFFAPRVSLGVAAASVLLTGAFVLIESVHAGAQTRWSNAVACLPLWATMGVTGLFVARYSQALQRRDQEIRAAQDRLVEADSERTRHMLRTTHELKAPFAAIQSNAQLLTDGLCGELPRPAAEVAERIAARCERLSMGIKEVLQVANLKAVSADALRWENLDLSEVLRNCLEQLSPVAQRRKINLVTQLEVVRVYGVVDHLFMLFSNLLSNAVNYSHPGGTVKVSCSGADLAAARVVVEDQGIGIAPEKLPRIFDDYYRTQEATAFNKQSTGMGLAIVRQVAQLHSIRLAVESAPNEGTTFTLDIPRERSNEHEPNAEE